MNESEDLVQAQQQTLADKRRERSQLKIDKQEKLEKFFHRTAWYLSMPIAVFAIILVLDGLLPFTVINENVQKGFRKTDQHEAGLKSFLETDHHTIRVPDEIRLNLEKVSNPSPVVTLHITSILKIPVEFALSNNSRQVMEVPLTIHTIGFPLKWLLLISSLFTVIMKDFSRLSYALCFFPEVLLATILLIIR